MHHKKGRPKNRRAGCLLCKPHKANGVKGTRAARTRQEWRADLALREGLRSLVPGRAEREP